MNKENIHITFIVHSLNPGGAERLAMDMALKLRTEFSISILCLDEVGIWAKMLRQKNIYVEALYREQGIDLKIPYLISKYTKKNCTDIIHAHQTTPWFYSALSRILNPKPYLLFEEHGRFYPEYYNKKRIFFNKLLINNLTHSVVAVSQDIKKRLIKYEGIPEDKIKVIYNGIKIPNIDVKQIKEEAKRALNLGPNDFIIGSVGRMDPIKNFPMLIRGVEHAKKYIHNLKCVIIGDGPEYSKIKNMVKEKKLEDTVYLPGYKKEASTLVSAFDLFVLTSFSEGISMAILEAMCIGIPCIATKVGGNPELIEHNATGWLVESDDDKSLANILIHLFKNRQLIKNVGKSAKKIVKEKFLFQDMIENYKRIYKELKK